MKVIHGILGGLSAFALIVILLISSFEIAAYSDFGWYEKEYEKYGVLSDLEMEMEDAMGVTREMMAYLRGNRKDLVVETTVAGEEREFFDEREKAHMKDVQGLFIGGLYLRYGAIVAAVVAVILLILIKADRRRILAKAYLIGAGLFLFAVGILGVLISHDFYPYFRLFHEIFFDNDLWILDWNTDLLIRMLPEGFFFDMALRIGLIFVVSMLVFALLSVIILKKQRKNKTNL